MTRRPTQAQGSTRARWRRALAGWGALVITVAGLANWAAPALSAAPGDPAATGTPAGGAPPKVYDANNPPEGVFEDDWAEVYMSGQKVGYTHGQFWRRGGTVYSESEMVIRLGRLGSVVELSQAANTTETVDGQPRAFHSVTAEASVPTIVYGTGNGTVFNVTQQSGSYSKTETVTLPAGALLEWGQERLRRLKGLAPGTQYSFLAYSPEDDFHKPLTTEVVVGTKETVDVRGRPVLATPVQLHVNGVGAAGGFDTTSWVDAFDRDIKTVMPLGGLTMELDDCTKAKALADYTPTDMFSVSIIALDHPVPTNANSVTYLLRRRDGKPLPPTPDSSTEHGEQLPDGAVRLTLARAAAGTAPVANASAAFDPAPYLARNAFLDTTDPELIRLAAAAAPAGAKGAALATDLRNYVSTYIDKKDMSVGFATAAEVARTHEGDCTEHAALLAALGRIRGLPARVAVGLAYLPDYNGRGPALGFHMWAQFYLDGAWRDYDAALPEIPGPPRRLALMASDLDGESMSDMTLGLVAWLGDLQVSEEPAAGAK